MRVQDFLKLVGRPGRMNFFVVCADELGIGLLLQGALAPIAVPEDIYFFDAESLTKEKVRQVETEARLAPRGGSELSHFFIYSLQKIPVDSVGSLLKAVEEARYTRFIFQAQQTPKKIHTLQSRSSVMRLPFLTKKVVLGNMRALNYDAKTADQLGLYDGTLSGTIKSLSMKDTMMEIQREMRRGLRGLAAMFNQEVIQSLAFDTAVTPFLDEKEERFLQRRKDPVRQKLVVYRALRRMANE